MATHQLKASAATVMRGVIAPDAKPVLTIASGDTVVLDTWTMWDNAVTSDMDITQALALRDRCRSEGRGPHTLTGPIAIETAKAGDVLKVEIERLDVADHGVNLVPGKQSRGLLADIFAEPELRHFALDGASMTATLGDRVTFPIKPFLGIMGVLPPAGTAPQSSAIPGNFGGNIDCADLVAGSVLYLPV